jgi:hypothetical protein
MFPTITTDVSAVAVVVAVVIFVSGYPLHELLHAVPLTLAGVGVDVKLLPGESHPLYGLTVGRTVRIEPTEEVGLAVALASLLAPGVLAVLALPVLAYALLFPVVRLDTLLVIGAWFVVFLPSALDWAQSVSLLRSALRTP